MTKEQELERKIYLMYQALGLHIEQVYAKIRKLEKQLRRLKAKAD